MSINALTSLAVARDVTSPGEAVGKTDVGQPSGYQSYLDAITSAIPTESLAPYTTLVGIVAALSGRHSAFRWWAYAIFLAATALAVVVLYASKPAVDINNQDVAKRKLSFPFLELVAAVGAGAAWGLVMPGSPLGLEISGDTAVLTQAAIAIGGGAVLLLLAPWLTKGSSIPINQQPAA